jgi:D-beta-D-heptose 7-phosphate kinase/D-beta-D-heptose 1-phosphate adenosyltransferase
MEANKLIKVVDNFKGKKICVVGDIMLDHFIWGDVERISPEAPVPVVFVNKETFIPGGAANTASNIAALGGEVFIVGLIGPDEAGKQLISELKKRKINTDGLLAVKDRITIQKTRVVARNQQVVRVDREICSDINNLQENKEINFISSRIKDWDSLVISDYNKGFVTKRLAEELIKLANRHKKPIIADTKPCHLSYFKDITVLLPNRKEAIEMAGTDDIKKAGKIIQKKLNCSVLIKQGAEGMALFEDKKVSYLAVKAKEVFDVVGAGDTVAAVISLSLPSGASLEESATIANHAAGIAVGKIGTAVVYPEELKKKLRDGK